MGAPVSAMTVMQAKIEKDWRNDANRKTNCDTANVTKAVDAAQEQLAALRTLEAQGRLDSLPEKLLQTALLRREHPEATLSELAELHEPPTSKSTVNHRMRSLAQLFGARSKPADAACAVEQTEFAVDVKMYECHEAAFLSRKSAAVTPGLLRSSPCPLPPEPAACACGG